MWSARCWLASRVRVHDAAGRLVAEALRIGQRLPVPIERHLVPVRDVGLRSLIGDDHVLLRLDVAPARSLLGGAQADRDLLVGHGLIGEPPDRPGGHDRLDRVEPLRCRIVVAAVSRLGGLRCRHRHLPWNVAGRLSTNALTASAWSAEWKQADLERRRQVEARQQRLLDLRVDRELRALDGERRLRREAIGPTVGDVEDLVGAARLGRHPEPDGLGGAERDTEHEVTLRGERPEQERPDRRPTVAGDEADLDVWIADDRVVGHHDHVAEERDRRAEPDRRPVQRADDRHLDVEQVPHDLLAFASQFVQPVGRAQRREPRHVAAGREGRARSGEHDRPGVAFLLQRGEQFREIAVERRVDGVEVGSRMVDHHVEHVAVALDRDRLHPADRTDSLVCVAISARPGRRNPDANDGLEVSEHVRCRRRRRAGVCRSSRSASVRSGCAG